MIKLEFEGKCLVSISEDGKVEVDPSYTSDQAALMFWEKVGRRFAEYDLVYRHMESVLSRLGQMDLTLEALKHDLDGVAEAHRDALEELYAQRAKDMEDLMSEAIELGRGLAKRPVPVAAPPPQLPEFIRNDEDTEYQGVPLVKDLRNLN